MFLTRIRVDRFKNSPPHYTPEVKWNSSTYVSPWKSLDGSYSLSLDSAKSRIDVFIEGTPEHPESVEYIQYPKE